MLTKEERDKIIEEEMLRMQIRQEIHAKTGCMTVIGKIFIFVYLWGILSIFLMVIYRAFYVWQFNQDPSPFYVLGVMSASFGLMLIVSRKLIWKR